MAFLVTENKAASLRAESNSFDCEDGGLSSAQQGSVGKSMMGKHQRGIFRSCGFCAAALIGFVALSPAGVGSQVTNRGHGNMASAFAPSRPLPILSTRAVGMSSGTRGGSPIAALKKKEPTPLTAVVNNVEGVWKSVFGSGNIASERAGKTATENAIAQRKRAVSKKVVKKVVAKKPVKKVVAKKVVAKKPVKKAVAKRGTKGKTEEKKGAFFNFR